MTDYESYIKEREITRLCHFTKSKNLPYILGSNGKLLANNFIANENLEKNDKLRLDGKEDYICCSVQYPNLFYLDRVITYNNMDLFKDWSILLISPNIINDQTLFCPCNAATDGGIMIGEGIASFQELYSEKLQIKRTITRGKNMLISSPTDNQAEVLIKHSIVKESIQGIVFRSEDRARIELINLSLSQCDVSNIEIIICPEMYEKNLAYKLQNSVIPNETIYQR
ncbi:hypothetical protein BJM58_12265 [Listeria monocytogenes]|uniref:DarT ssDNA thymidine ADP-ribosyltransferase family protein n=1 Tax=Listeria monocytogenes TaxID=1639 RepID=UPI000873C96B|nr:DarT ssDNA thymidine ADP-ribosyltransferase family protein [Listeria monocytogenes]EGA0596980.1 DUF4433 domain-containing protein [Listeria monocytogenes]OFG33640.1 hypothetical protein BJM58_12265 [Listeria monocytogenes]